MNQLHVGRGTTRGALTVFPIWAETQATPRYTLDAGYSILREKQDGPTVSALGVLNMAEAPLLLLEGQLVEGGLQHRMVARTTLVPSREETVVDVVCVEQGRWAGQTGHATTGRRASARVRLGLRGDGGQQEVWRRVAQHDGVLGTSATGSYVEKADRAQAAVDALVDGLHPFPGQVGVLVGISGQPVLAEVFDAPSSLAAQHDAVVRAAALDALGRPAEPTPARRAHRFLDRAALVAADPVGRAGIGVVAHGADAYAERTVLRWDDEPLHTVLTNPRHELALAV